MANFPTATVPESTIGTNGLNLTMDAGNAPNLTPAQVYQKALLEILRQTDFHWDKFGKKVSIEKNAGTTTVNFRKLAKLGVATTPLTEGITPSPLIASKTNITGTVAQYGAWMAFSDKVSFQEFDPIIAEYTRELGYQAKETMDYLVREIIVNGTNVHYAQDYGTDGKTEPATPVTTRANVASKANMRDFRKIVRDFRKDHVRPAMGKYYVAFVDDDTAFDLMDDPTFQKYMDYGKDNSPMLENEIGNIFGIKFLRVPNVKVYANAGADIDGAGAGTARYDVHCSIVLGANAYGVIDVAQNGNAEMIVKPLGSAGVEDALNQRQSVGWKLNGFGAIRLEELAICRYEHTVTQA